MSHDSEIGDASRRADVARAEFRAAFDDALGWLTPARLKAEAALVATQQIDEAKAALGRQVRRHPLVAWSGLAALAALLTYILRRPVAALIRSGTDGACALFHRITRRKA